MKKITPVFGPQELFNGASEFVEVIRFNDYSREYLWGDLNTIQLLTFGELKAIPIVAMRRIEDVPDSIDLTGDIDELITPEFNKWWEEEGEFIRSGGGNYERSFAYGAFRYLMPKILGQKQPEPKRWTVEDQKAGRLPEVGCIVEYFNNNEHDDTEVTAQWRNGDELEILRHQNKNKAFVVFNARTERSSDLIVQCMKPIETPEEKAARLCNEWCKTAADIFVRHPSRSGTESMEGIYKAMLSGDLPVPGKDAKK